MNILDDLRAEWIAIRKSLGEQQISRIRLSDKTSRLHPRHVMPKSAQTYEPEVPVEVRGWIGPAPASPDLVLGTQPPTQPHSRFQIKQLVARRFIDPDQLVELEVQRRAIAVLRVLDKKDHQERDDRRARGRTRGGHIRRRNARVRQAACWRHIASRFRDA
jgi:hypothetical protein